MLPAYSCTEYVSPSGNTQIYIVRQKRNALRVSEKTKYIIRQKLLGMALIAIGITACMLFPEDCGGAVFACFMGILRVIF